VPAERLSMRKIREILRLRRAKKLGQREVANSVGVSPATVAGLSWPLPEMLDDEALESLLYPPPSAIAEHPRAMPVGLHPRRAQTQRRDAAAALARGQGRSP